VTASVIVLEVALSQSSAIAKSLIGEDYSGIMMSDRYSGYSWRVVGVPSAPYPSAASAASV